LPGEGKQPEDSYSFLVLRFFRDLSPADRINIFIKMGVLPEGFVGSLYESFERGAFDRLISEGRGNELRQELQAALAK
jgi:hypothetical protein